MSLGIVSDGRRIQELSLALRQTFEEAVQTQLYPRSQIDISVLVMEQDGGIRLLSLGKGQRADLDRGVADGD